jgi:protein involved in polysaccharide export with SLBB domain
MTLSDAIRLAGGAKPGVYLERILVTRTRPDSSRVQLRSAFADTTGTVADDIALAEGDVVEVFSRTAFLPEVYVTVTGAVRNQGRIPFREGMTLRDAVLVAGGLDDGADLREAEIARIANRERSSALAETIRVPLDSTYLFNRYTNAGFGGAPGYPAPASGAPEAVLRPYDNVVILRQPGWDLQRLVWVTGQVKRPGRYALTSKTERLASLIERAGGLTDDAYPGGVEFYRVTRFQRDRDLRRTEDERRRGRLADDRLTARPVADADAERRSIYDRDGLLSTTPGAATPDTGDVPFQEELPDGYRDRVGVDLVRALKSNGSHHDIILAGGDSLHVPEYEAVILVTGAVNSPGPVAYEPGKDLDWYVRAAGGYSARGDSKRAYVTQPNGKKESVIRRPLLADGLPVPGPGGQIYVPTKIIDERDNAVQVLGVAASAIASLITAIAVIAR